MGANLGWSVTRTCHLEKRLIDFNVCVALKPPAWHDNTKVLSQSWLWSVGEKDRVVGPEKPLAPGSCTPLEVLLQEGSVLTCPASTQHNHLCHS